LSIHEELCSKTKAMKEQLILQYIRNNSFSIIVIICLSSCTNQEKEYSNSFYKMETTTKEDPIIDFSIIDCLNESNQKVIELSSTSLRLTKDLKTLQLLLKIKRDHKKINSDFNRLTKDNLIIIPKLICPTDISNGKSEFYILKKLQTEIKKQIISLDSIEKKTKNIDFKLFAIQSKRILKHNNEALKTLLSS